MPDPADTQTMSPGTTALTGTWVSPPSRTDRCLELHLREQCRDDVCGFVFLPESKNPADRNDHQDDGAIRRVVQQHGQDGGADQEQNDRGSELPQQEPNDAAVGVGPQRVRPVLCQPSLGFRCRETGA